MSRAYKRNDPNNPNSPAYSDHTHNWTVRTRRFSNVLGTVNRKAYRTCPCGLHQKENYA